MANMQCVVNHKVDLFFSQFTSLSQKQRNLCVNLTNSLTVLELKQPWQHLYDDHLYDDFRCSKNTRLNCNSHILKIGANATILVAV